MDLARKLQHMLMRLSALKSGKYFQILARHQRHPACAQCSQSDPCVAAEPPASQDVAVQIDARAKKRPDSGVTVIAVPNTADT